MNMARIVLIVVTLVGMAMCTPGIGKVAAQNAWLHPLALVSIALGVIALVIAGTAFFGIRIPFITSDVSAIVAVIVIVILKIALTRIHGLV